MFQTTANATHGTKTAHASATKSPGTGREGQGGESAAQRRARELAQIEKFRADKGITCKRLTPKPLPVVLTQAERDRAEVWKALHHGADCRCPADVDWRNMRGTTARPAPVLKMPPELRSATKAAALRAASYFNHIGALTVTAEAFTQNAAKFPPCGWWVCAQKDQIKEKQWADFRAALEILQSAGINPNSEGVARDASTYAEQTAWRREWPTYKLLDDFIAKVPAAVAALKVGPSVHLLRRMNLARWAGHGCANPPDRPLQLFLNKVYDSAYWRGHATDHEGKAWVKGTPAIAAAILHFFGLGKEGERLKALKHRIEMAWGRPGELGWGRPGNPNGRQK